MPQVDEQTIDEEVEKGKLCALIEKCLAEAVGRGATDIHVGPRGEDRTR